jgi:pyridoxal phosphate enzyme (YggS family)
LWPVWHLIGHLQSNKVKSALGAFAVIHSVDSEELARTISRRAERPVEVLLEVNVAGEASKFGLSPEETPEAYRAIAALPNIDVRGLMTVAPQTDDPEAVRPVFRRLRALAEQLGLPELSMGMSGDYEVAVEEGATMVRVGSALFGPRPTRGAAP